ncbi:MAG: flavodoxin domain-containing protein [Dehalococcoidales bacterium]|jgi:menaquinone-dependent protoporphyrinogen oxidase
MGNSVLIAYASKYGSTKEIAEKIGEILKLDGLPADILPVKGIKNPADYQAIIIGSAMYMGMWRKEATNFVKKYETALAGKPVWVFSSGPSGKGDPAELLKGIIVPRGVKPLLDRIKPRDIAVFHGHLDPAKMSGMERWIVKRVGGGTGDFRDWDMINQWAKKVAAAIKSSGQIQE